jgi:DNA-binding CsgD family transcriptional regulator/PAS domain-containing protein
MKGMEECPRFLLDLLNQIYEIPEREGLLSLIHRTLKEPFELSPAVALIPYDGKNGVFQLDGHVLLPGPSRWIEEWLIYFSKIDPLANHLFRKNSIRALRYSDFLSEEKHFSSRFFKEFLLKIPASWVLVLPLSCYGDKLGMIWLTRESREKDFNDLECEIATILCRHAALALKVQEWRNHPPIDQNSGIVVVDPEGKRVYRNEEMERIFPEGPPEWITREEEDPKVHVIQTGRGAFRARTFPLQSVPSHVKGSGEAVKKGKVVILEPYPPKILLCQRMKELDLSRRQSEIVLEVMRGKTNKEISEKLLVSIQTVKDHIHDIFRHLNVRNRSELILRVMGDIPFSDKL